MNRFVFCLMIASIICLTPRPATAVLSVSAEIRAMDEKSSATAPARRAPPEGPEDEKISQSDLFHFRFFPLFEYESAEIQPGAGKAAEQGLARQSYRHWSLLSVPFLHAAEIGQGEKVAPGPAEPQPLASFPLSSQPDFEVIDCPLFSLMESHVLAPDRSTFSVLNSPILNVWRQERYGDEWAHYVGFTPLVNLYAQRRSPGRSEFGVLSLPLLGWAFRHEVSAEKETWQFFILRIWIEKVNRGGGRAPVPRFPEKKIRAFLAFRSEKKAPQGSESAQDAEKNGLDTPAA